MANLRESELPTRWVYQLLGFMFVVTAVGGLVGVLAPTIEFTSAVEMLLPRGLRSNGLVQAIVHPAVADVQNVLGRLEARPKAPFPYANSWGSNLLLFLPFFLVAWFRQGPALAAVRRTRRAGDGDRPGRLLAEPWAVGLPGPRRRGVPLAAGGQGAAVLRRCSPPGCWS